jgi:signal peptidase I
MLSTIVFVAVFVGLLVVSVVLWALCLRLGLWWAKAPDVTMRRVVLATATIIVLQIMLNVLFAIASSASDTPSILLACLEFAAAVIVAWSVIARVFRVRFLRAVQAWFPTLAASVATILLVLLVLRPFVYDAFVVPTNSMAPTLVGDHWRGMCPECGEPNYTSPVDARYGRPDPPPMICRNFHVAQHSTPGKRVYSGDRFLAAKFFAPRRWDLIVFQYPEDPSTLYVKRLVGLPGEEIIIREGSVWANGKELKRPDSIRGIEYLAQFPDWPGIEVWGSLDRPARLAEDEYFVLGDFSAQAKDSRFWERGVPGHNPFAVPESYLTGVVTHIYWPLSRWRVLR